VIDPLSCFDEVWLHDFEFAAQPGERPNVVCLAGRELRSGQTLLLRRDQLTAIPPYRTDSGVLFVSFVANAELACHLALGWPVPRYVLDLNPVFRNLTNGRHTPEGKGLIGAARYFNLDTVDAKRKEAMQKRIMAGPPFTEEEWQQILAYCLSDVETLRLLLLKILAEPEFDLDIALYHGEAVAALARMEHHGVPFDMEIFTPLADQKTWRNIRDAMVPMIDAQYGVYVRDAAGDWSFNMQLFEAYLVREGIAGWPRTETGKLDTKRKTFDAMAKGWLQLEDLRQLRHARNKMRKIKLAVGSDGRNRTVLWPCQAKTGRTQPKASTWSFSPAVWLRGLIKPGPGMAVAYIDYAAMEFLIAAALSGDQNMLRMYRSGDPYLSFAKAVGAVPPTATKQSHGQIRDKYKVMLLASQYLIGADTLASRLGVSTFEAQELLNQHHAQFSTYWRWSDDWTQHALQAGIMRTHYGWTCRTGITEFNARSIANWPVQACGSEILRVSLILGTRHGIKLLAPVHDAVLIEAPIERIEADVALMREIMRRASRIVLGNAELRTDYNIVRYPDRYSDPRGIAIWQSVLELLTKQQEAASDQRQAAAGG
jgi:hypothetical protein